MNAVVYQQWDNAMWLLAHGVSPEVKGADGATVASLLRESGDEAEDGARKAFLAALTQKR
jgi:hypothetical protein